MKENIKDVRSYDPDNKPSVRYFNRGSSKLVITFPSIIGYNSYKSLVGLYEDVDHLAFTCEENTWMTYGDGTYTHNFKDVIDLINEYCDDYDDITLVGSSAGGYATLSVIHRVKVSRAIIFDPVLKPFRFCRDKVNDVIPSPYYILEAFRKDLPPIIGYFSKSKNDRRRSKECRSYGIKCINTDYPSHGTSVKGILNNKKLFDILE